MAVPRRKRFGEILVEAKVVDEPTLNRALERQKQSGKRLGQVLEELGVVTERDIAAALARQFGFKTVSNLSRASFPPELLKLTDGDTAMDKLAFPLKKDGNVLYLAMVNPLDMEFIDKLAFSAGVRIVPCVTTPSEIQTAVNRHYYGISPQPVSFVEEDRDDWWTILVVDDQELVRAAVLAALKREGYNLLEAPNGADALKLTVQKMPHLIISDTIMPRMDGYELFRAIQANLKIKHIPVVALSSKSSAEEEAKLLELGYFDFIAKPINPVRLVARIKRALRLIYGNSPPPRY
ncbi:MAG: two-component system response regulator [Desulfuromonas sp.]|nr:MAG: two-component system response regulator [Desulfuromonas sp.]